MINQWLDAFSSAPESIAKMIYTVSNTPHLQPNIHTFLAANVTTMYEGSRYVIAGATSSNWQLKQSYDPNTRLIHAPIEECYSYMIEYE